MPNYGGYLPGGGNYNDLEERKKALAAWLSGRGATQAGYRGRVGSAVGRMGGIGGRAPLPSLTYNPFFAQIAGRNENFPELPAGISQAAAQAVQQGPIGPGMGLVGNQGGNLPGIGADAAPGVVQGGGPPNLGGAGRNLIGVRPPIAPPQGINLGGTAAPLYQPYVPPPLYPPQALAQGRGSGFRM